VLYLCGGVEISVSVPATFKFATRVHYKIGSVLADLCNQDRYSSIVYRITKGVGCGCCYCDWGEETEGDGGSRCPEERPQEAACSGTFC